MLIEWTCTYNSGRSRPLKDWVYKLTADLTSTSPQAEVNDHQTSLRVTCDQHVEATAIVYFLEQEHCFSFIKI